MGDTEPIPSDVDRRSCCPLPRGVQTIASIERQLTRLAKRHSRLLPPEDNHHGCNSSSNSSGNNNDNKKSGKKKNRKGFLERRHIHTDFHGNYDDQDETEIETEIANDDDDDDDDDHSLSLFEEFAITVCHAGRIPRKELFEAWAMALYVNHYFPPPPPPPLPSSSSSCNAGDDDRHRTYYSRVADLCSGHGLVSWAILFLDTSRQRTAVCVDIRIPQTCDSLERTFLERHPNVATFAPVTPDDIDGVIDIDIDIDSNGDGDGESKEEPATPAPALAPTSHSGTHPNPSHATRRHKRWHWVEGDICRNVSADSSNLLVGVHCCGTLSDAILDLTISSRSALALVPCCHTRKSLPGSYRFRPKHEFDALLERNAQTNRSILLQSSSSSSSSSSSFSARDDGTGITHASARPAELLPTTLTDFVDRGRIQKLTDAGFAVREEYIPSVITPKNRIIIATPPPLGAVITTTEEKDEEPTVVEEPLSAPVETRANSRRKQKQKKKRNASKSFSIPLADAPNARAILASVSGRTAARLRERTIPPYLSLSVFLSDPDRSPSVDDLRVFADSVVGDPATRRGSDPLGDSNGNDNGNDGSSGEGGVVPVVVRTRVGYETDKPHTLPDGRSSRTIGIRYGVEDDTGRVPQLTKEEAKALHTMVCRAIHEGGFPGIELRQGWRRRRDAYLNLPPKAEN